MKIRTLCTTKMLIMIATRPKTIQLTFVCCYLKSRWTEVVLFISKKTRWKKGFTKKNHFPSLIEWFLCYSATYRWNENDLEIHYEDRTTFFTKMEKRRCTNMERNLLKFVIESRKKDLVIWTASSLAENRIKFDRFAVSFPCDSYWCTAPFRTISKTCNAVVLRTHHRDNDDISKASYENCYHQTLTSYTLYFILSLCLVQHPINWLRQLFIDFLHLTNKSFLSKQFANIDKDYMSLFQLFRCHSMYSNFKITIIDMFCY